MTGGYLDSLAVTLSTYGEVLPALLVLSVLYWCIDKRLGQYLLIGWGYNRLANGIAKITVCAYRPWIRDPRVQPGREFELPPRLLLTQRAPRMSTCAFWTCAFHYAASASSKSAGSAVFSTPSP